MDVPQDLSVGQLAEQIAEGLWRRFRDVVLAMRRLDSFVFDEVQDAEASDLGRLLDDDSERDRVAIEWILRALARGLDPANYRILRELHRQEGIPLSALARKLDLARLAAAERISELIQVGLAQRELETGQVQATGPGEALVLTVEAVRERLSCKIREGLAGILGERPTP